MTETTETAGRASLRRDCLPYVEVLAQSVSVIAPTTVPAAIIGLIFATAGNGTWLSFLFGMCGMVLVGLNINQFARRSASPGSLYTYIVQGLGPTAGILGGWALVFGYTLTGMSTLCGFAIIADLLLGQVFGLHLDVLEWLAIGVALAGYTASRDIQMSARMMLLLECVALLSVMALGVLIWSSKGFAIDPAQLSLKDTTPGGVLLGVVLVVFAFSGFESSTALGDEAKDPLRSIPRSVTQSVLVSGLFFIFMAYVIVAGFSGEAVGLGESEAPLDALAARLGWGWLGSLINVGILLSFFACTIASVNSTARILFAMSRHGLFVDALGEAHQHRQTPHVAVWLASLLTLALPAGAVLSGVTSFEAQGHFGTLASFGFIVIYILITIAAPVYLKRIGRLTVGALLCSGGGLVFMSFPLIGVLGIPGSTMLPPIGGTTSLLLGAFTLYMAVGFAWIAIERNRRPGVIDQLQHTIDKVQVRLSGLSNEVR